MEYFDELYSPGAENQRRDQCALALTKAALRQKGFKPSWNYAESGVIILGSEPAPPSDLQIAFKKYVEETSPEERIRKAQEQREQRDRLSDDN